MRSEHIFVVNFFPRDNVQLFSQPQHSQLCKAFLALDTIPKSTDLAMSVVVFDFFYQYRSYEKTRVDRSNHRWNWRSDYCITSVIS